MDIIKINVYLLPQAGPLSGVSVPSVDKECKDTHRGHAFVEFQHEVSVKYAIELLNQISLFGSPMKAGYMTADSCRPPSLVPSPTTTRSPPLLQKSPQNFLSFFDSPKTDATQVLAHNRRDCTGSNSGGHHLMLSMKSHTVAPVTVSHHPLLPTAPPICSGNVMTPSNKCKTGGREKSQQGSSSSVHRHHHSNHYNGHRPKSHR